MFNKIFIKIFLISNISVVSIFSNYEFIILHGQECAEFKEFMIDLRITLYRDYPYLYEADRKEEEQYLPWFLELPRTFVAVAFYQKNPIAFVAGTDFFDFRDHFNGSVEAFEANDLIPCDYFYISDCLVKPEHQNQGILRNLLLLVEDKAKEIKDYKFCLVTEDHDAHPLKPVNFESNDIIWQKLGYKKSDIKVGFTYLTLQSDHSQKLENHILKYWLKS